ncbi:MAG: four helix bundle protein [Candidatus Absconditabacteria bacterium]
MMFDFEKLEVYKKAKLFNKKILMYLNENKQLDYFLKDQLKRASISIVINIAEGSGRFTKPDKKQFYVISRGSIFEVISLLEIILDKGLIAKDIFDNFYQKGEEISKMLLGLIKSLE